jgi:hypothetical protein
MCMTQSRKLRLSRAIVTTYLICATGRALHRSPEVNDAINVYRDGVSRTEEKSLVPFLHFIRFVSRAQTRQRN